MCPMAMTYSAIPSLRRSSRGGGGLDPEAARDVLRPAGYPVGREVGRHHGHVHDGEAGRLRRAHQYNPGEGGGRIRGGRRRVPADRAQVLLLGANVGRVSDPRVHPPAACRVSWCRAGPRTASATTCSSSASRTSSAIGRTHPPRSRASRHPGASWSARKAGAFPRSSTWSGTTASTAARAPPP